MFLGLPDLHLNPLVTSPDQDADPAPDSDPSFSHKILVINVILIIKHIFSVLKLLNFID